VKKIISQLFQIFDLNERKKVFLSTLLMIVLSALETLTILFLYQIVNFINSANDKQVDFVFFKLIELSEQITLSTEKFIAIIFLILICFKVLTQVYLSYFQTKLATSIIERIGNETLGKFLDLSFYNSSRIESSNIIKLLTVDLNNIQSLVLLPFLSVVSEVFVIVGLIGLLLIIDPVLTMIFLLSLTVFYFSIFRKIKNTIMVIGQRNQQDNNHLIGLVQEIFYGLRDIIVFQRINMYSRKSNKAIKDLYEGVRKNLFLSTVPRSLLDFFFFASFSLILYFRLDLDQTSSFISSLVIFAASAIRILPSLSKFANAVTQINFGSASLNSVLVFFNNKNASALSGSNSDYDSFPEAGIKLIDFSFSYLPSGSHIFENQSISIKNKAVNLIYGESGSGKSTLIHIILGLYPISDGEFFYGQTPIEFNSRNWLNKVGYLPQDVFIANNTISFNITLTEDQSEINYQLVDEVIRKSSLDKLIASKIGFGLDFICGENGSKLSGGEIQRIGIARLLYFNREILVFDEPTSALDLETGRYIRETLKSLTKSHTVIIISHDESMADIADSISHIENGQIYNKS
jgi:ATP-binding cassette, subfamily B, bacterial PglK